jgi:hypothetical protein
MRAASGCHMTESRKTGPDATPAFSKTKKQTMPAAGGGGQGGEAASPWPAPAKRNPVPAGAKSPAATLALWFH